MMECWNGGMVERENTGDRERKERVNGRIGEGASGLEGPTAWRGRKGEGDRRKA